MRLTEVLLSSVVCCLVGVLPILSQAADDGLSDEPQSFDEVVEAMRTARFNTLIGKSLHYIAEGTDHRSRARLASILVERLDLPTLFDGSHGIAGLSILWALERRDLVETVLGRAEREFCEAGCSPEDRRWVKGELMARLAHAVADQHAWHPVDAAALDEIIAAAIDYADSVPMGYEVPVRSYTRSYSHRQPIAVGARRACIYALVFTGKTAEAASLHAEALSRCREYPQDALPISDYCQRVAGDLDRLFQD